MLINYASSLVTTRFAQLVDRVPKALDSRIDIVFDEIKQWATGCCVMNRIGKSNDRLVVYYSAR